MATDGAAGSGPTPDGTPAAAAPSTPKPLTLTPELPLGRALFGLLSGLEKPCVLQGFTGPDSFVVAPGEQPQGALVLIREEGQRPEQQTKLKNLRKRLPFPLVVAVLGGGEDDVELARGSEPMVTPGKQQWVHIADDGTLSGPAQDTPIAAALREALLLPREQWPDEAAFQAMLKTARQHLRASESEQARFARFQRLRASNKPKVTVAFLAMMLVFFGLEVLFGGSTTTPTLLRLGALRPERVFDGELYRLLSVALLHAGGMHLALNGYVLFILGRFLEQIIGSWRFAALLVFSVIGGSLASLASLTLLSDAALSVGASGGLWGVLAGHAVLAWWRKDLLPEGMVAGAQRAAVINLGINLFASFQTNVDWAAHFGGGLFGAALFALVLQRGLPALKDQDMDDDPGPVPMPGLGVRALTVGLVGALLVSGVLAVALGRPWVLSQSPTWADTASKKLGVTVSLPTVLELARPDPDRPESANAQSFGDPLLGPAACTLFVEPATGDSATVLAELEQQLSANNFEGSRVLAPVARTTLDGQPAITVAHELANGLHFRRAFKLEREHLMVTDCVLWPEFADQGWTDVAERIAASMHLDPHAP